MTPRDRRVASLAALFAPARAAALLARDGGPGAPAAVAEAARLAAASRQERLAALAAWAGASAAEATAAAHAAAALERPRVAAVVRRIAAREPGPGISAALVRLCRERIGR